MKIRKCTLLVTYACNLHCKYCYEKFKDSDPSKTMTFDIAKRIVLHELSLLREKGEYNSIEFNFFGGEPLLQFLLIRNVVEWAEKENYTKYCFFTATSNGTLVDSKILNWCKRHRSHFVLGLSVDGADDTQLLTRGCSTTTLPLESVQKIWPNRPFKMTISQQSLGTFAANVINFQEKGYEFLCSLAVETAWTDEDAAKYGQQLRILSDYYISNRQKKPLHIFLVSLPVILNQSGKPQQKRCGIGDYSVAYDFTGTDYPCIALTPIVTGKQSRPAAVDFSPNSRNFIDPSCESCLLRNTCPTCYGQNLINRGAYRLRDHSICKMQKTELREVARMQATFLKGWKQPLNDRQKERLRAAEHILELLKEH